MGWATGVNNKGREVGYGIDATCDHPGCNEEIDRGLSYVCGEMHDEDEYSCDKYFCEEHRQWWVRMDDGRETQVCQDCYTSLLESGDFVECEMEGLIKRKD